MECFDICIMLFMAGEHFIGRKLLYVVPIWNPYHSENCSFPLWNRIKCSTFNLLAVILPYNTIGMKMKLSLLPINNDMPKTLEHSFSFVSYKQTTRIYTTSEKSFSWEVTREKNKTPKTFHIFIQAERLRDFIFPSPCIVYPVLLSICNELLLWI